MRDHSDGIILESQFAHEVERRVDDAQFLKQLATRTVDVRLAGGEDSAGGHVPVAGPYVFVVGPPVDEQPIVGVEHGDSDTAVTKVVPTHPRPRGDPFDPVEVVHHVDEVVGSHRRTVVRAREGQQKSEILSRKVSILPRFVIPLFVHLYA